MTLDNRILALIAVGASVTANCQPCLQINVATAAKCGADDQQIAEAIEIGKRVRHGAASKMDKFIASQTNGALASARSPDSACGCNS